MSNFKYPSAMDMFRRKVLKPNESPIPYKLPGIMNWKPGEFYDITREERDLIEKRSQIRKYWREQFNIRYHDPFALPKGTLSVHDPAIGRLDAFFTTRAKYYRPTIKYWLRACFLPLVVTAYLLYFCEMPRWNNDKRARAGEVLLKDRRHQIALL